MGEDYATKSDVRTELQAVRTELQAFRDDFRHDLHTEIGLVRDDVRALGIMVERTQSNISAVIEVLSETASKSDVRNLEERLSRRLSLLEEVAGETSGNVLKNSEDIRLLRNEVAQLRLQFDRRELRVDELERRIAEVEARLGIRPSSS